MNLTKINVIFLVSVVLCSSCTKKSPYKKWLASIEENDVYFEISDSALIISPIYYGCDTLVNHSDSIPFDSIVNHNESWTFYNTEFGPDFSIGVELFSKNEGEIYLYNQDEVELNSYLSIPDKYYSSSEPSARENILIFGHKPILGEIRQTENLIYRTKLDYPTISSEAKGIVNFLDSLESALNSNYNSNYPIECIHRDYDAYINFASTFLLNDAANPTDKYFSAVSLKNKLILYYNSLKSQDLANDLYNFDHLTKSWNDIITPNEEIWEVQEFYKIPYHQTILKFRQLELLIYQLEKHQ